MLVTRKEEFCASHACWRPELSEQQNLELYGEPANPHGHGHNYVVEVTLEGRPDPLTGMVLDLRLLKQIIRRDVVEPFDHRFLNREVPPFDRLVPTPENIAVEIWRRLAPHFPDSGPRLHAVRLYETEDLYVEYSGERA